MILFDKVLWLEQEKNVHLSVVIKDRERDIEVWKNFEVHSKWGWNNSPFDIKSVVFHFDDFNYGRRSQPYLFLTILGHRGPGIF